MSGGNKREMTKREMTTTSVNVVNAKAHARLTSLKNFRILAVAMVATMALTAVMGAATSTPSLAKEGRAPAAVKKENGVRKSNRKSVHANHLKPVKKAVDAVAPKTVAKPEAAGSGLSREVVFDGSVVNGKYLSSGEAISTVETEKTLNNLIGLRADFKDRLLAERNRLKQAGR